MVSQPPKSTETTNSDGFNAVTNRSSKPLLLQRVASSSSPTCQPPARITILTNPARNRIQSLPAPTQNTHPSSVRQSPPRITILSNPARARWLPSTQNTPSSRQSESPPRVTILTNPARQRQRAPSHTQSPQNTQDVSPAAPAPKRTPTPISALNAPAPAQIRTAVTPARAAPKRACLTPAPNPRGPVADAANDKQPELLPEIVVHEPVAWDVWRDVHHPCMSYGTLLDVPAVNVCSRLYEDDVARFYPREYAADQVAHRLRSMVRSGSRLAAARRRERTRQRRQATSPAPATFTPTPRYF